MNEEDAVLATFEDYAGAYCAKDIEMTAGMPLPNGGMMFVNDVQFRGMIADAVKETIAQRGISVGAAVPSQSSPRRRQTGSTRS